MRNNISVQPDSCGAYLPLPSENETLLEKINTDTQFVLKDISKEMHAMEKGGSLTKKHQESILKDLQELVKRECTLDDTQWNCSPDVYTPTACSYLMSAFYKFRLFLKHQIKIWPEKVQISDEKYNFGEEKKGERQPDCLRIQNTIKAIPIIKKKDLLNQINPLSIKETILSKKKKKQMSHYIHAKLSQKMEENAHHCSFQTLSFYTLYQREVIRLEEDILDAMSYPDPLVLENLTTPPSNSGEATLFPSQCPSHTALDIGTGSGIGILFSLLVLGIFYLFNYVFHSSPSSSQKRSTRPHTRRAI